MTIAVPTTGETCEAQLVGDENGLARLVEALSVYLLSAVLRLAGASSMRRQMNARCSRRRGFGAGEMQVGGWLQ
jgi:hypothetical protein